MKENRHTENSLCVGSDSERAGGHGSGFQTCFTQTTKATKLLLLIIVLLFSIPYNSSKLFKTIIFKKGEIV